MSADLRLKGFIDRVLRMKEEQDTLAADIREVYAEAKGEGYDKTAMGELVSHLRKVEKKGADAVAEKQSVFDLYLDAYERASGTRLATHTHAREANEYAVAKGAATRFATGEDHDADSGKHVGRKDDKQRDAARVSSAHGRREGADEGDQGQGDGASGIDRHGGPVEGTLARQDEDGRSGHVGREARHEITETDGDAFAAVKGTARLANVDDVEPSPSNTLPVPSSPQADRAPEACPPPQVSGATISDADVPTFLISKKTAADYRPHCQRPDACAASGLQHCYSCRKAMAEHEAA